MASRAGDFGPIPVLSRKMEFEELISVLITEHAEMKRDLAEVRKAVSKRDFLYASRVLRELDSLFKQHIADEEAQVLRILIDAYGVKGPTTQSRSFVSTGRSTT